MDMNTLERIEMTLNNFYKIAAWQDCKLYGDVENNHIHRIVFNVDCLVELLENNEKFLLVFKRNNGIIEALYVLNAETGMASMVFDHRYIETEYDYIFGIIGDVIGSLLIDVGKCSLYRTVNKPIHVTIDDMPKKPTSSIVRTILNCLDDDWE